MNKAYILVYVIRTELNGLTVDTDYYEVFCEASPLRMARKKLAQLEEVFCKDHSYLYSWNIAKIFATSEHYLTSKV